MEPVGPYFSHLIPPYHLGSLPFDILEKICAKLELDTPLSLPQYTRLATDLQFNSDLVWELDRFRDGAKAMGLIKKCCAVGIKLDRLQLALERIGSGAADIIPSNLIYIKQFVEQTPYLRRSWQPEARQHTEPDSFSGVQTVPLRIERDQFVTDPRIASQTSNNARGGTEFHMPSATFVKEECRHETPINSHRINGTDNLDHDSNLATNEGEHSCSHCYSVPSGCFVCTCSHQSGMSENTSQQEYSEYYRHNFAAHRQSDDLQHQNPSHQQPSTFYQDGFIQQPNTSHQALERPNMSMEHMNTPHHSEQHTNLQHQCKTCQNQGFHVHSPFRNLNRPESLQVQGGSIRDNCGYHQTNTECCPHSVSNTNRTSPKSTDRPAHDKNTRGLPNNLGMSQGKPKPVKNRNNTYSNSDNISDPNNNCEAVYDEQKDINRDLCFSNDTSDEESGSDSFHGIAEYRGRRNKVQLISKHPCIFVTGGSCPEEMDIISKQLQILGPSLGVKIEYDRGTLKPGEGKWKQLFDQADIVLIGVTRAYVSAVKNRTRTWTNRPTEIQKAVGTEIYHSRSDNLRFYHVIFSGTNLNKTDLPLDLKRANYVWPQQSDLLEERLKEKIGKLTCKVSHRVS